MNEVRKDEISIIDYLEFQKYENLNLKLSRPFREEENSTFLLLLFDNIEKNDILHNRDFFEMTSKGPISIVYTTK